MIRSPCPVISAQWWEHFLVDDALVEVRRQFRQRCSGDLRALRSAMREPRGIAATSFQTMVHRISGIAGTLGFPELGAAAVEVDRDFSRDAEISLAGLQRLEIALAEVAEPPGDLSAR
nr:Hpt domain-containing protein [Phenylobacterium glaciei]